MTRIRTDNVFGTLTDNPLTNGATTMNSAGLANLAAVSGSDRAVIVLDPRRLTGAPEIVYVSAHTAAATSATIIRGQEGTASRQHAQGTEWVHAPTVVDFRPFNPPRAEATRNTAQSITNNAWNLVTFNVESRDTDGLFTTGAGDRFTATTAGRYAVFFTAHFAANATGQRGWAIAQGTTAGANFRAAQLVEAVDAFGNPGTIAHEIVLAAGGTVSLQVFQNSGGALNIDADGTTTPIRASVRWVAED